MKFQTPISKAVRVYVETRGVFGQWPGWGDGCHL